MSPKDQTSGICSSTLPGRSVEVRKGLSMGAIKIAKDFLGRCGKEGVAVSAEIVEMTAETYSK